MSGTKARLDRFAHIERRREREKIRETHKVKVRLYGVQEPKVSGKVVRSHRTYEGKTVKKFGSGKFA